MKSFSHAFANGLTFAMGLLKYQVIIDYEIMREFTSGDVVKLPAKSDTMELEVAIRSVAGWKRGIKLILRPMPGHTTPEIDIEHCTES